MQHSVDPRLGDNVLTAVRAGDSWAWDEIDRRFRPALIRYAARRGVKDAEDLAQEVLSAVFSQIDRLEGDWNRLRAWIFTVAYRRCADHHRRRYRRPEILTAAVPEQIETCGGADEALWSAGEAAEVTAALSILAERERDVVSLRVLEELSTEKVAQRLGMSRVNVRVTQSRALGKLRSHLEHNGGHLDRRFRGLVPLLMGFGDRLVRRWRNLTSALSGSPDVSNSGAEAMTGIAASGAGAVAASLIALGTVTTIIAPGASAHPESPPADAPAVVATVETGTTTATAPQPVPVDRSSQTVAATELSPTPTSGPTPERSHTTNVGPDDAAETTLPVPTTPPERASEQEVIPAATGDTPVAEPTPTTSPEPQVVEDLTDSLTDTTKSLVEGTATVLSETVSAVTGTLESGLTNTVETTGKVVDDVVTEAVEGTVSGTVDAVEETVSGTVGAVEETTEDLVDVVGGVLGGVGSLLKP